MKFLFFFFFRITLRFWFSLIAKHAIFWLLISVLTHQSKFSSVKQQIFYHACEFFELGIWWIWIYMVEIWNYLEASSLPYLVPWLGCLENYNHLGLLTGAAFMWGSRGGSWGLLAFHNVLTEFPKESSWEWLSFRNYITSLSPYSVAWNVCRPAWIQGRQHRPLIFMEGVLKNLCSSFF
jgi:hypothetical protein